MAGGRSLTKWLRLRWKKRQNNDRTGGEVAVNETRSMTKLNKDARKRKQRATHLMTVENEAKPETRPSKDTRDRKQDRAHRVAAFQGKGKSASKTPKDARERKQDRPSNTNSKDSLKPRTKLSNDALTYSSDMNVSVSSLKRISVVSVPAASVSSRAPSTKRHKKHLDVKIVEEASILESLPRVKHDRLSQFKGMLAMLTSCVSCKYENEFNEEELLFETDTLLDSNTLGSTTLSSRSPTLKSHTLDSHTSDSSRSVSSSTETSSIPNSKPPQKVEPSLSLKETWVRLPPKHHSASYSNSLKSFEEMSHSKVSGYGESLVEHNSVGFIPIHEGRPVNVIMAHSSSDTQPRSKSWHADRLKRKLPIRDRIATLDSALKKNNVMVSPRLDNRREWSTLTPLSFDENSAKSGEYYNNEGEEDNIWKPNAFMQQGEPWMGW